MRHDKVTGWRLLAVWAVLVFASWAVIVGLALLLYNVLSFLGDLKW